MKGGRSGRAAPCQPRRSLPRARRVETAQRAFLGVAAVLAVMLGGCSPGETQAPAASHDEAKLYQEGKGLRLPEETRRSYGLQTVVAGPQAVHRQVLAPAQVFARRTNDQGLVRVQASALVSAATPLPPVGADVRIHSLNATTNGVTGTVVRTTEAARSALGQVEIVMDFPDPGGCFAMGTFAEARLEAGRIEATTAVPRAAVVRAALGDFVYVVEGEFLRRTAVQTGAEDAHWMEIRAGLPAGASVVAQGAQSLWLLELSEVGGMANIK